MLCAGTVCPTSRGANYVAEASAACDQEAVCSNCMPIGEEITPYRCWAVPSPILYYVHEYGQVHGEAAMMSEIHARGPITCGFASVDDFDYAYVSRSSTHHTSHAPLHCSTTQGVDNAVFSHANCDVRCDVCSATCSAAVYMWIVPTPQR